MRVFWTAAAVACVLAAGPATAGTLVFSGSVDPYFESIGIGFTGSGPGTYRIDYRFSAPATGEATAVVTETYNFFDETGGYLGGDDTDQYNSDFFVEATSGSLQFKVDPGYRYVDALGWLNTGFFYLNYAYIQFYSPEPGTTLDYRVTTTYLAQVPEPATWTLMILGFGAIGGAMRRRRSVAAEVCFA